MLPAFTQISSLLFKRNNKEKKNRHACDEKRKFHRVVFEKRKRKGKGKKKKKDTLRKGRMFSYETFILLHGFSDHLFTPPVLFGLG